MKHLKNILLAEDEAPLAKALSLKLINAGFEVTHVDNGVDAVDKFKQQEYLVVLLDLMMPKKDGFAVLEEIIKHDKTATVFVLSNLGQEEDKERVLRLGAAEYYIKADTSLAAIVKRIMEFGGE